MNSNTAPDDPTVCRRFIVSGHVQGVWFRDSTRRQAAPLGIRGFAKNLADGTVEVLACGDPANIRLLASWLHEGPPRARVTSVTEVDAAYRAPADFSVG